MSTATLDDVESDTTMESPLVEWVRQKLDDADKPLKLSELMRGSPKKPAKVSKSAWEAEALAFLDDEYLSGRVFRYPSSTKNVERFWRLDEKQAIRTAILDATEKVAIPLSKLKAIGKGAVPGVQPAFVETVFRELIDTDDLYEHPGKTAKAAPNFAAFPPPPPLPILEQPANKKKLDTLAKSAKKLLDATKVSINELLQALAQCLSGDEEVAEPVIVAEISASPELAKLIMKEVENAPSGTLVILPELRMEMPIEFQGKVFDQTVLKLAHDKRIHLFSDSELLQFSEVERKGLVYDEYGNHFVSIAIGG